MKRRGNPGRSGTRPDDPEDAAAVLEGDGEELVQLDEDHARNAQRRVDDEVVDVVGGGEDSMAKETTGGTASSRRGDPVAALHAWGGGPHDEDGHHRSQVDRQGEVGGGVPIGGGNDELVKIHVWMKRQG